MFLEHYFSHWNKPGHMTLYWNIKMRSQLLRGSTSVSLSVENCTSVACAVRFNSIGGRSQAVCSYAPQRSQKSVATALPAAPKAQRSGPSAEQKNLGEGWNHVVQGGRVVKASTIPPSKPHPNPPPQKVTKAPSKATVTATRVTARPKKPEPKPPAAPQRAPGKSQKKAAASAKTAAAKPSKPSLVVPTQNPTSPLEDIIDLFDHLSNHECVELTRRLLTSISSLPKGAARSRAVLKIVILFIAEYGSTPQED